MSAPEATLQKPPLGEPSEADSVLATLARFLGAGAATYALYVGAVFVLEIVAGLPGQLANLIGYVSVMVISFAVARGFIFRSDAAVGRSFAGYVALAAAGFVLNQLWVWGGLALFSTAAWVPALLFAGVWAPLSFLAQRYVIFADG